MSENNNINHTESSPASKGRFLSWLDNFWYHYKWHSLIALFLVFTITVCSLQMCTKTEYDIYIVYAGQKQISRIAEGGAYSEYETVISSLNYTAKDFDENGKTNVSLLDLFMLSNDEIKEAESVDDQEVNYTLLASNQEKFKDTMLYSNYYICLLSDTLYLEYAGMYDVSMFTPIEPFTSGSGYRYLDEGAIYLHGSGLEFASLPGICELPENTVICMRGLSAVASHFGKEENEQMYQRSSEMLRIILETSNTEGQ